MALLPLIDLVVFFIYNSYFKVWSYGLATAGIILVMLGVMLFVLVWYAYFKKDFSTVDKEDKKRWRFGEFLKLKKLAYHLKAVYLRTKTGIHNKTTNLTVIFKKSVLKIVAFKYWLVIIWPVILLSGFIHLTSNISHEALWYDESYSAAIINHPVNEIWKIAAKDSHPPLYFIMLRLFSLVFGRTEASLRMLSVMGIISLAMLGVGPVRRALGSFCGMIYAVIVLAVPMSLSMGQETRMYTWAAFFVTGSVLYGYLAMDKGKVGDFIKLTILTLASAYTHYYALLGVAIAHAVIIVYMLIFDRRKIVKYLISAAAILIGFAPWISTLTWQIGKVSKDFWIPSVTWKVILDSLVYPFRLKFQSSFTFTLPLFTGFCILIYYGIKHSEMYRKKQGLLSLFSILTFILTLIGAVTASELIRPVFVDRYIFPVMGLFLLSAAYGLSNIKYRDISIFLLVIMLILSVEPIVDNNKEQFNSPMHQITEYINPLLGPDDIFIHTDEHTFGMFSYYFPNNKHYLYLRPGFTGYSSYDAFAPLGVTGSDVKAFIKDIDNENIWLITNNGFESSNQAFRSGIGHLILNDTIKYKENPIEFTAGYSFYRLGVRLMEKG